MALNSVFINERVRDGLGAPSGDPGGGSGTLYSDLNADSLYVWDSVAGAWEAISGGGSSGITIGTTTITSGTSGRVLYDNAGVVGEMTTTGSGTVLALATSPTLVTPLLGTPTSGNLANCTGYTIGNVAGLGANVGTFLATPSSANLAAAVTDETGSGALVFATSPTLVTPTLGVASATSVEASGQFFAKNAYSNTAPAYSFTGATNTGIAQSAGSGLYFVCGGTARFSVVSTIFQVGSTSEIGWSSAANADSAANDTKMFRDGANIVGHRNDASAQAWRLYNTFTSTTNYERLELDWITTANTMLIGCQKGSGGGTARVLNVVYGGTTTAAMSVPITSGQVTFGGGVVTGGTTTQGANFEEFTEMTPPSAGAANTARIYADDSGGKTRLMVIFNTGAAQQIAIQP